jgi:hypothetical protein
MAAVRNWSGVVYDVTSFVESAAASGNQNANPQSWLGRSFRVAEQFVISRAAAVIVHSQAARAGVLERGGAKENVFVIARPLDIAEPELRFRRAISPVPVYCITDLPKGNDGIAAMETMMQAAVIVDREVGPAVWWLDGEELSAEVRDRAQLLGLDIRTSAKGMRIQDSDVVITFGGAQHADTSGALAAMLACRPLLAADVDGTRDTTPEGAGCLWFRSGDVRELAGRASFLARNAEFCSALGDAGRRYICESRSPYAIALQYDAAYRHAAARRRTTSPSQPLLSSLQPLQCLL